MLFAEAFSVRDEIKNTKELKEWLADFRNKADEYRQTQIPDWTDGEYLRYFRDGNRLEFEKKYFDKRGRLAAYALMAFIYRDAEFIPLLEEIAESICSEKTWVLPAHNKNADVNCKTVIDLFAAETACALSEVKYLLSESLSDKTKNMIHSEVSRRVVQPYLEHGKEFWWFESSGNWSAVCSGNAALACMYESPKDAERAIMLAEESMAHFLSGFSEEGACMEGYSYWVYGFGAFLVYADSVYALTNGRINHFADERIHKISQFVNGGLIRPGALLSFGDVAEKEGASLAYSYYLSAKYPDIGLIGSGYAAYGDDTCYRWIRLVRTFVWVTFYKNAVRPETKHCGVSYYPDAGWYIKKTSSYILCAKGGNNAEPHNHNDAASFYIDNRSKQILADFGSGEYTRDYFGEKRYDIFVCGSQGHNLPIIDGKTQKDGIEHKAKILHADDGSLCIEAAAAYGMGTLRSFVRSFCLNEDCIELTDCFEGEIREIRERFVTNEEPKPTETGCIIDGVVLDAGFPPEIGVVTYHDHDGAVRTAATVDFVIHTKRFHMTVEFNNAKAVNR